MLKIKNIHFSVVRQDYELGLPTIFYGDMGDGVLLVGRNMCFYVGHTYWVTAML